MINAEVTRLRLAPAPKKDEPHESPGGLPSRSPVAVQPGPLLIVSGYARALVSPDDLLLEVLLNPGDESLRAVYVDQLLERGDPRGEHARLLRQGRVAEASALAERHGAQWLPSALRPFIVEGTARFRDGLLDSCALRPMPAPTAIELAAEPLWSALTSLANAPAAIVAQARRLTRLERVDDSVLAELALSRSSAGALRHLGLRVRSVSEALASLALVELPSLESMAVTHLGSPPSNALAVAAALECCEACARELTPVEDPVFRAASWQGFVAAPIGARLKRLELHVGWVELRDWLPEWERTRLDVDELALRGVEQNGALPPWELVLRRTAPGRYGALELTEQPEGIAQAEDVRLLLRTMPPGLELVGPHAKRARRLRGD